MSWTNEQTATTVKMWGDGFSASQIAIEIGGGLSRNAVIGKVHRMGLPRRKTVSFVTTSTGLARAATPKPRKGNNVSGSFLQRAHRAFKIEPIPEPVSPSLEYKTSFFDLENKHCRYPLWGQGVSVAEQFFCGSPLADLSEGRSYCPFHQARTRRKGSDIA